jgi:hypothetical protein
MMGCHSPSKISTAPKTEEKIVLQEESRPIQYVFVSEPTENNGDLLLEDKFLVTEKIFEALLPALYKTQKAYFVGSPQSFRRLVRNKKFSDSSIGHIDSKPYMWLQDLIEFAETTSGPTAVVSYGNLTMIDTVKNMVRSVNSKDPEIRILKSKAVHGTGGGNIEKWPGQIGVLGSSDFETDQSMTEFARQIFPTETFLKIPTSWLTIGHVDEVVKLLEYKPNNRCELLFLINSPDKALEILDKHANQIFLDELEYHGKRISEIKSIQQLCQQGDLDCKRPRNGAIRSVLSRGQLKAALDVAKLNLLSIKEAIIDKYKAQLPNCSVRWIEAPSIYLIAMKNGLPVTFANQRLTCE